MRGSADMVPQNVRLPTEGVARFTQREVYVPHIDKLLSELEFPEGM